jgi:hypothetical protein
MARGKQLLQLVNSLRAETGQSLSPASGTDVVSTLKEVLTRTQELLWDDYDWPFATIRTSIQMVEGEMYYDFPDEVSLEGIEDTFIWWGDRFHPFERGISLEDYSIFDSDAGETDQRPRKWDVVWTGDSEMIEVWPIPSTSDSKMWIVGKRDLPDMVSDSDTATLDDRLIVLFAAAEILARQDGKDAQGKLALAQNRLSRLRGRVKPGRDRITVIGGGDVVRSVERLRAPR